MSIVKRLQEETMLSHKYEFLGEALKEKLGIITRGFLQSDQTPEELVDRIKEALPVYQNDENTWKKRLEGMFEVSELLVEEVMDRGGGGAWDRLRVIREANIRPMSYYHRITGARESTVMHPTLKEYFVYPSTALIKLEDDIFSLANLLREMEKETE